MNDEPKNADPINASDEPTLAELADACESARTTYRAAKAKAAASDAQAKADVEARELAHAQLRSAIFVLDNAAKAEDPDPG